MSDKISVIMSAFNVEAYLAESITSILQQENVDLELLIVNDGSTDKTGEIIQSMAALDNRIVLIEQINQGLPKSLNNAISLAKGEYIARMDSDDIALPDRLYTQLQFLRENQDINIVGSYLVVFGDGKTRTWKFPVSKWDCDVMMLFRNPLAHPAVMFRRSVLDISGKYDVNFAYDQDYELWARVSGVNGIANIPRVLLKYRIHPNQMGSLYTKNARVESQQKIQIFLLSQLDLDTSEESLFIHLLIANAYRLEFDAKIDSDILEKAGKWILKIFEKNREVKRYNQEALGHCLLEKFYSLCLYSADTGMDAYLIYQRYQRSMGIKQPAVILLVSSIFKMGRKSHLLIYKFLTRIKNIFSK